MLDESEKKYCQPQDPVSFFEFALPHARLQFLGRGCFFEETVSKSATANRIY